MDLLALDGAAVRRLLPMPECIEVIAETMKDASSGGALMPLRTKMDLPSGKGVMGYMPGAMLNPEVFGAKLVGVFPGNHKRGLDSHNGVVVLFEGKTGRPFLVADAAVITSVRTAAASAFATRHLAREDASALTILGYGNQARAHAEAMACVRPIRSITVWGRSLDKAEALAEELARDGIETQAADTAEEAISGADIICTTTASPTPILMGEWLEPGQHVNAIGTSIPGIRELDTEAIARSRFFVDSREGAINQAGEFQMARDEGAIDESHILGEIGEVANGMVAGRVNDSDITVYKSLGLVVQDLASAFHIHQKAVTFGDGTRMRNWSS